MMYFISLCKHKTTYHVPKIIYLTEGCVGWGGWDVGVGVEGGCGWWVGVGGVWGWGVFHT